MKHIYSKIILGAVMTCLPFGLFAQTDEEQFSDSLKADSKVNTAFRVMDQQDLMGGISVVNMNELLDKSYSTYSLDNMSALVGGYTGQLWNMGEALVLIDGVPRAANNVMPTEIEQITFLKSAAAVALYGSRAAKGVILITTKRGAIEGLQVKVRGNASLFVPKAYPKYLGAAEYMTLYNEARGNDGLDPFYSDETIYNTAAGTNPYRYPDVNFFSSDYIKKTYNRYDATAEFSGGGRYASFYTNINFYNIGDLMNFGEGKDNHTNRLSVRGNVDLRLNDQVTGWVNTNATFYDARNDNAGFWGSSASLRPDRIAPLIPIDMVEQSDLPSMNLISNSSYLIGGKYLLGGTQENPTNPFAAMYAAGYNKWTSRQFQFDAGINIALDKVLQGLSFRTQFAVDYATSYSTSINNGYATYEAIWSNYSGKDLISSLNKYGKDTKTGTQNLSGSAETQTVMFSAQFNYNRTFKEVHHVSAMLLANGYQQTISGAYHRTSNANLGLQAMYNYQDKYYADFSGAVVHSAKLAPGHRQAFSPTLSLAWRLSKENFLIDSSVVDDLKLTASASCLNQDLDITSYYMYGDIFTATGSWWGWSETSNSLQSFESRRAANEDLTFVKRKEFTVGVDASLWKGLVKLNANFFHTTTEGLITTLATAYPNYFQSYYPESSFVPYTNYNNQRRTGFDFSLNLNKKVGQVDLNLGINGMYNTSKATRVSENVEDYLRTEGHAIDALWGLRSAGFYKDDADVAAWAKSSFGEVRPGDIKYVDQNNDGTIDDKDRVVLGKWGSDYTMGVNLTAKWKGLTFFAMMTGSFGGQGIKNNSYMFVYGNGKYSETVRNRWTPETAETATYPRLTTSTSAGNNFRTSDFWVYDSDRIDLGRVQVTYDLPKN
ncbi:SusC/RagA family TonB-linked outer membrane protein, partial [Bacteroides sp. OttesenSCG-928-M17]|nr:SusC/RagA family TonB-linked outer membrane protein [Bacteroides sp. OttesenSCG-928-M17]